jgi:protein arginine N-methyltransferase 1
MRAVERRNSFDDIALHEEMLADSVRLDAYYAAIERYVRPQHSVVDIGTGTGVLAFFAAAKNPRKIYAIDHSNKMLDYARAAAEANGITNISFVGSNSPKFRPRESIDVILQEQMGIGLFDEGMLEALIDVRDRCLAPGGRILPAKFEFLSRAGAAHGRRANPPDSGATNSRRDISATRPASKWRLLLQRDLSSRCRFFALRPRACV